MRHRLSIAPEMTIGEHGEHDDHRTVVTYRVKGHPTNQPFSIWRQVNSKRCHLRRDAGSWEGDFDSPEAALAFLQAEIDKPEDADSPEAALAFLQAEIDKPA